MTKYSRTKLAEYIADAMNSGKSSDDIATHVAAYLIESGKTSDVDSVMRDVQEVRAAEYGVVELTARSVFALDAEEKREIERIATKQYPRTKSVIIHEEHDQSLVGGATLSLAQANLDLTIRSKLNRLRASVS